MCSGVEMEKWNDENQVYEKRVRERVNVEREDGMY